MNRLMKVEVQYTNGDIELYSASNVWLSEREAFYIIEINDLGNKKEINIPTNSIKKVIEYKD